MLALRFAVLSIFLPVRILQRQSIASMVKIDNKQNAEPTGVTILTTPEKSPSDKKEYRAIKLANGLVALLISDVTAGDEDEEPLSGDEEPLSGDEEDGEYDDEGKDFDI
jgi:hypothetical protein